MSTTTTAKPNLYPGTCTECGANVAANAGTRHQVNGRWTVRHLSGQCVAITAIPVAAPVARIAVDEVGVYVMPDGSIVRVKPNQSKTRTYACRWVAINGERLTEADTREHGEYVYEAGLVNRVATEGRRMTLDEAKAFTIRYGRCCRCGRGLKAADSVERGIGPVCIRWFSAGTTGADLLAGPVAEVDAERAEYLEYERQFSAEARSLLAESGDGGIPTPEAVLWTGERSSPFGSARWARELAEADAEAQEAARVEADEARREGSEGFAEARKVAEAAAAEIAAWEALLAV